MENGTATRLHLAARKPSLIYGAGRERFDSEPSARASIRVLLLVASEKLKICIFYAATKNTPHKGNSVFCSTKPIQSSNMYLIDDRYE